MFSKFNIYILIFSIFLYCVVISIFIYPTKWIIDIDGRISYHIISEEKNNVTYIYK